MMRKRQRILSAWMSESKAAGYGTQKKDFANAVKYNPDDYELYVGIYENLAGNNMTEEGEEYLNKAFDIKGNSAENLTCAAGFIICSDNMIMQSKS